MSSSRKAMLLGWCTSAVFFVACSVLAYLLIDRSISLSYARESQRATGDALRATSNALELALKGRTRDDVLALAAELNPPDDQDVEQLSDDTIYINGVVIRFAAEGVIEVNPQRR